MAARKAGARITMNKFPGLGARVRGAVGSEVRLAALDLLSQAVNEAPVDEGPLRGSGTVHFGGRRIASGKDFTTTAEGDEGVKGGHNTTDTKAAVAFNTVYAEAQHERVDYAHPKGGKAKYLEDPVERNRAQYQRRFAAAAKKALS